jgi:hypothetical protein
MRGAIPPLPYYIFMAWNLVRHRELYLYLSDCFLWATQVKGIVKQATEEIFGPKRKDITGGLRKVHNEELHNLYASPDIVSESN